MVDRCHRLRSGMEWGAKRAGDEKRTGWGRHDENLRTGCT